MLSYCLNCRNKTEKKQRMVRQKGKLMIYEKNRVCKIAYFTLESFKTLAEDKLNKNE